MYENYFIEEKVRKVSSSRTFKINSSTLRIETFEKLMPQTLSALEKYLANGNIKGVGPATASKIIKLFGDETIHVLKYEPSKLVQIKGITKDKAKEISESFIENWEVWQIVGFLERFGLGAESAKKVYDLLGINAISEIENDPYILIDIARGVEFSQIDKMAIELGIERENQKRVKSGIKYALMKITYNGHCCTLKENLIEYVKQLLGVAEEIIEEGLINLKANEDIVIEKRDEEKSIGNDVCSSNGNRHDSMWRGESSRDSGTVRKFPDTGDRNTGCSDRKRRRDSRRSSLNNRFTF